MTKKLSTFAVTGNSKIEVTVFTLMIITFIKYNLGKKIEVKKIVVKVPGTFTAIRHWYMTETAGPSAPPRRRMFEKA